jgi:hypothetical protein
MMHGQTNIKYILSSIYFFTENRAIYEIMWKNRGTDKEAVGQDALGMPGN